MSKLEVNKIDPQSGTDLELGTSGDTITIPAGVTFDSSAATNTLPSTVVTTTGTQTLTNKSIVATQLTGTITPSDNTVSLAKLTATGTQDATTFLRGDNTFAEAGGGLVLQVVTATTSTSVTQTANSYATSGLSAAITPSSSSNKVLVITSSAIQTFGDGSSSSGRNAPVGLFRGTVAGTKIQENLAGINMVTGTSSTNDRSFNTVALVVLDSPSTTSAQTYTVGISGSGATDITAQGDSNISTITLLEIAG